MSSDLATLFTGRTFELQIFPFSFEEYCKYYDGNEDVHTKFQNYVFDGGMSGSYNYEDKKQKSNYIKQIFNTLIVRDIIQRNMITQIGSLEKITEYLIDVSTSETSTRNIANYLESNKLPISHTTVSDYLSFLCNAFMFYC